MINYDALTCSNCGAPIDRSTMTCPYCKTQYSFPNPELKLEVIRPGAHKIYCQAIVPNRIVAEVPDRARDYTLAEMRNQLAEGLLGYMKISTSKDFREDCQIIKGEVMVLDPYFG